MLSPHDCDFVMQYQVVLKNLELCRRVGWRSLCLHAYDGNYCWSQHLTYVAGILLAFVTERRYSNFYRKNGGDRDKLTKLGIFHRPFSLYESCNRNYAGENISLVDLIDIYYIMKFAYVISCDSKNRKHDLHIIFYKKYTWLASFSC